MTLPIIRLILGVVLLLSSIFLYLFGEILLNDRGTVVLIALLSTFAGSILIGTYFDYKRKNKQKD